MKPNSPPHTDILIREAQADDAADIVRLIRQLATSPADQSPITEAYVSQYLSGTERHILLAESDGDVKGLLSYSVRADLFHAGNSVLIEELVVDKENRGQGIGGVLMDALHERLQELRCKEVCLAVMPDNDEAIRFYKRHGLTEEALFLERHFPD